METVKVIDRVRKLLALSKSNNLNEAASAAESARKLMTEHRLSLTDVDESEILKDIAEESLYGEKFLEQWRFALVTTCGLSNCCKVLRVEERTQFGTLRITVNFVGHKDDAASAKAIYEYLEVEMLRLRGIEKENPRHDRMWFEGAVLGIHEAFSEGSETTTSKKSLVISRKISSATDAYVKKTYGQTIPKKTSYLDEPTEGTDYEMLAYHMGYSTGQHLAATLPSKKKQRKKTQ